MRWLAARVDWLTFAFRVQLHPEVLALLKARGAAAQRERCGVAFELYERRASHPWQAELKVTRAGLFVLSQPGCSYVVDLEEADELQDDGTRVPGFNVKVDFGGAFLVDHDWREALYIACVAVQRLGTVYGARLRRMDLCADFVGLDLDEVELRAFVKRGRVRIAPHVSGADEQSWDPGNASEPWDEEDGYIGDAVDCELPADDAAHLTYVVSNRRTGIIMAPGGLVSLTLYNKSRELVWRDAQEKAESERRRWAARGYDEKAEGEVARAEFRLRSEALHQFHARDLFEHGDSPSTQDPGTIPHESIAQVLEHRIDAIWQYLTRVWCRLAIPDSATRPTRWNTDPRWLEVQAVRFTRLQAPAKREWRSRGARPMAAFGNAASLIISTGRLRELPCSVTRVTTLEGGERIEGLDRAPGFAPAYRDPYTREIVGIGGVDRHTGALTGIEDWELLESQSVSEHEAARRLSSAVRNVMLLAGEEIVDHLVERMGTRDAYRHILATVGGKLAKFSPGPAFDRSEAEEFAAVA